MPKIEIVCLANSRKLSDRCVAGIRTDGGGWLRPVTGRPGGGLSDSQVILDTGQPIRHLDIAEIEVVAATPKNHQPENWLIADTTWVHTGTCEFGALQELLHGNGQRGELLGSCSDRVLKSDLDERPIPRSLDVITPNEVTWVRTQTSRRKPQVRARFEFREACYDLAVTDPLWESKFTELAENDYHSDQVGLGAHQQVLLTISLGEPMGNGYCFKLVAGVVVLPSPTAVGQIDTAGSVAGTLAQITRTHFDTAFNGVGRFEHGGWVYEGAKEWPCPTCGAALHAARKPYESSGKTYRYWALMCPHCQRVWAPEELDPHLRKKIYRSTPGTAPDAGEVNAGHSLRGAPKASSSAPETRSAEEQCPHGTATTLCSHCSGRPSSRAARAFAENQRRVLSGETFRARKASTWSRRPRKRK